MINIIVSDLYIDVIMFVDMTYQEKLKDVVRQSHFKIAPRDIDDLAKRIWYELAVAQPHVLTRDELFQHVYSSILAKLSNIIPSTLIKQFSREGIHDYTHVAIINVADFSLSLCAKHVHASAI